jgi:hypothetical protein
MRKATLGLMAVLSLAAICAAEAHSGDSACQSVRLEVIPEVEANLSPVSGPVSEKAHSADGDQIGTGDAEFGQAPLVVSPDGYGVKLTVTSEPGTSVEVSVEARAGGGDYPRAAVRLTLTDP